MTATGAVVVAGIAYGAGTAIYNLVKKAISSGKAKKKSSVPSVAGNIPDRLKKSSGYVDLGKFNKKLRGGAKEEKKDGKLNLIEVKEILMVVVHGNFTIEAEKE